MSVPSVKKRNIGATRRSRSGEINALFRGSSLRKTSSLDLGWQGVAIERRTAEPGESPEEEVDHHFIAMWDRQAALGERADLRGKFVPYAAGASRLLPSLRGLGRMMEVQVENDLRDSANGADHALEAKASPACYKSADLAGRYPRSLSLHRLRFRGRPALLWRGAWQRIRPSTYCCSRRAVATIARACWRQDLWPTNLGSERDWAFRAEPNPHLNGRVLPMSMGKVLGGGSSINVMVWARGHKTDWDYFAAEAGDTGWSYESVLALYRRIEDWGGAPDPAYRGVGGPLYVQPAPDPSPIAPTMVEGARSIGIPTFENQNGRMMEGAGGGAIADVRLRHGRRLSVFRSYVYPYMDRPNLTVLTGALVTRLIFEG
jgi:hypothetical protein